jgi:sigma-B regulation protein RsbU (phosphoserine phosphatase)
LLRTLPGRAIVIGIAVKLLVRLIALAAEPVPPFLDVVDSVATLTIWAAAIYFLFRLFVLAKRRLLWRVRRKLILSYIFIGFVPAILIVTFFALCGLLLFANFSSYLIQTELRRAIEDARFVATSAALEIQRSGGRDVATIVNRKQATAAAEFPGAKVAVIPVDRPCATTDARLSTPDSGLPAPDSRIPHPESRIPAWIGCAGFSGLLAQLSPAGSGGTGIVVRAVAFPESPMPGYAVVVDLPIGDEAKERLRRDTGVELRTASRVVDSGTREDPDPNLFPPRPRAVAATSAPGRGGLMSWVTFLEDRDWDTGKPGTILVTTRLSIPEIYQRLTSAPGLIGNRSFGQVLLLVLLIAVGGSFLVIQIVALLVGFALAKSITGSVHELFTGTERVRQGDFTHKIDVKAADQLGELAESFNSMTASIEDLLREQAEKKRLEEELRIAHEIQMSLLPQGPLSMPGLSVTALCVPAREVGGDYYDFLPLDDHRVGVLIADVSGKGTSAALYMAELKGLVLSLSQIHRSPRELLITANRIISEHLDARSFITMTYAVLDLRAGTMTYARAGHTPLIYVPGPGSDSRRARILTPDGLVLGLKIDGGEMFERLLEEETMTLHEGDLYVFFTDGISEAMNVADDCFGEGRLGQLVETHADLPSDELRERVLRDVEAFVGGAPQHDDMTMILLKVEGLAAMAGAPSTAEGSAVNVRA